LELKDLSKMRDLRVVALSILQTQHNDTPPPLLTDHEAWKLREGKNKTRTYASKDITKYKKYNNFIKLLNDTIGDENLFQDNILRKEAIEPYINYIIINNLPRRGIVDGAVLLNNFADESGKLL